MYKSTGVFRPGTLELAFEAGDPARALTPWIIDLAAPPPTSDNGMSRVVFTPRTFESLSSSLPDPRLMPLSLKAVTITFKPSTPPAANTPSVADFDKFYIGIWNDFNAGFTIDETGCVLIAMES
jgi:hypothetical protein